MATQATRCCFGLLMGLLLLAATSLADQGNPLHGRALFVGSDSFANGGAPCIACHALAGQGLAGTANFGPDLSPLYEDYGADGVGAVLESLEFPSMEAIFASRPLTEAERLDMQAFFAETAGNQTAPATGPGLWVVLGIAIVFAVLGLAGMRRLRGVRRPLVEQAEKQRGVMS